MDDTSGTRRSATNRRATPARHWIWRSKPSPSNGYEPRRDGGRVVMANCPFHALAQAQTQLVCQMNHALIGGVTDALGPHHPVAELDPAPDRCCVVLTETRTG